MTFWEAIGTLLAVGVVFVILIGLCVFVVGVVLRFFDALDGRR